MIRPLHICILTSQYFDWGIYGGFGSMSKKLAESLVLAGHSVTVIVPRRAGQQSVESIQGVTVRSFSPFHLAAASRLIKQVPADIFHSQDPTVLTYLAQKLLPERVHVVTCRDPRGVWDWWTEFRYATPMRRLLTPLNYLTESSFLVKQAVRRADRVFVPAHFLKEKVRRLFRLPELPGFLPNLIDVPAAIPQKSGSPIMTFVARWDKRKRPWLFLELAKRFPEHRFIAVGKGSASAEEGYDQALRAQFAGVPNLMMTGFIDRFREPARMEQILAETWVFVSTAAREGLPLTFLEAAAHGCAILSSEDPDGFATKFGRRVVEDDFEAALRALLSDSPQERGQAAYRYVRETYECGHALAAHVRAYSDLLGVRGA